MDSGRDGTRLPSACERFLSDETIIDVRRDEPIVFAAAVHPVYAQAAINFSYSGAVGDVSSAGVTVDHSPAVWRFPTAVGEAVRLVTGVTGYASVTCRSEECRIGFLDDSLAEAGSASFPATLGVEAEPTFTGHVVLVDGTRVEVRRLDTGATVVRDVVVPYGQSRVGWDPDLGVYAVAGGSHAFRVRDSGEVDEIGLDLVNLDRAWAVGPFAGGFVVLYESTSGWRLDLVTTSRRGLELETLVDLRSEGLAPMTRHVWPRPPTRPVAVVGAHAYVALDDGRVLVVEATEGMPPSSVVLPLAGSEVAINLHIVATPGVEHGGILYARHVPPAFDYALAFRSFVCE